jgi:plastocyanin
MNEDRHDTEVVDDRPYSRRWLVRGAAAFAVAGGIGSLGMVRWASATGGNDYDDSNDSDDSDDEYEDRGSLDDDDKDDDKDDDHGDDDHGGDDDDDDDDKEDDEDAVGAESAASPDENRVEIRDETFIPSSITVSAGEWVTWINFDDDEHTATGEDFDTGDLETGARAEVQFNTPGTYAYVCQYHSDMVGEVIVLGAEGTPQASPEASPEASPAASPVVGGGEEAVSIIDFAFEPQTLQVPVGTTVVWTNDGSAPHTVTGDPLDSGTLSAGDSFQFTFNSAGTFDYVCAFHPQMTGTIEVTG